MPAKDKNWQHIRSERYKAVRKHEQLTGIDYVQAQYHQVNAENNWQLLLTVYFIEKLVKNWYPQGINHKIFPEHVQISNVDDASRIFLQVETIQDPHENSIQIILKPTDKATLNPDCRYLFELID